MDRTFWGDFRHMNFRHLDACSVNCQRTAGTHERNKRSGRNPACVAVFVARIILISHFLVPVSNRHDN
jgi:hypothetical protein